MLSILLCPDVWQCWPVWGLCPRPDVRSDAYSRGLSPVHSVAVSFVHGAGAVCVTFALRGGAAHLGAGAPCLWGGPSAPCTVTLPLRLHRQPWTSPAPESLASCPDTLSFPHWPPLAECKHVPGASCDLHSSPAKDTSLHPAADGDPGVRELAASSSLPCPQLPSPPWKYPSPAGRKEWAGLSVSL